jgi:hypothetical protein
MPFQWVDYLALAETLLTHRTTFAQEEACCRASISRAYYAVFCAARNYARDHEGLRLTRTGVDHQTVQRHFQQQPSRAHQELQVLLDRLRTRRNAADYTDTLPNTVAQAQGAIQYARRAFQALDALHRV